MPIVHALPRPLTAVAAMLALLTPLSALAGSAATTTTSHSAVPLDPKAVVAAVRSAAFTPATRVAARVGAPSCPSAVKAEVGLTFQCLVPFDTTPVAFLVTIGLGGSLVIRPTFPVVGLASARLLAGGGGGACGPAKAKFVVLPIGATLDCTSGTPSATATVTLRVRDQFGTLQRVP